MPSEHGGWGLTLEPVLLGLLVAPSWAGLALSVAAFGAFLLRTPLKLALVDRRRGRHLERTALATRVAVAEAALLVVLAAVALALAGPRWLVPCALAAPLVGVELWFDVRSRGRRLVPEVCGAVGMAAVAAVVVVAGGGDPGLAFAAWAVLAGRSLGAIPFVRVQIQRLRLGEAAAGARRGSDLAQLAGTVLAAVALVAEPSVVAGVVLVAALGVLRAVAVRRPPVPAKRIGTTEMGMGLAVVVATAVGVLVGGGA